MQVTCFLELSTFNTVRPCHVVNNDTYQLAKQSKMTARASRTTQNRMQQGVAHV